MSRRAPRWRGRDVRTAAVAAIAVALTACAATSASGGDVLPDGATIDEPVVRVGAFADVRAIAVAPSRAFIVANGGLAIYDRNRRHWLAPISLGFAGPREARFADPCAAVTNLIGDAVWIACGTRVTVVRPAIRAVWATDVGAPIGALAVSRGGADAWAFIGGSVAVVSASGSARPLAPGETVPVDRINSRTAVGGDQALLRSVYDPLLVRDDALRVWPPTAIARGDAADTWIGTLGGGLFIADIDFHRSEQMPFGLRGGSVRVVTRTATGVMVAEDPAGPGHDRSLITTASDDLATWQWPSLMSGVGAVSAIVARDQMLCVGGELGASMASLTPPAASLSAQLENDQRIYEPVTTAIATRAGCIVGTDRSAFVLPWVSRATPGALEPRALGTLAPVRALAASGDSLWIGTLGGLYLAADSAADARPLRLPASVQQSIVALAITADGLAIAGPSDVWLGSGRGRTESFVRPHASMSRLGRLAALASDGPTLWIGGTNGALAIGLTSGQMLDVPLDDPRAMASPAFGSRDVRSIALAPGVAWIGTGAGLVRVRRGADGLPR